MFEFFFTKNHSKRVLIIVALDILKKGEEVGHKIGDPISLSEVNKQNGSAPTQSAPSAAQKTNPSSNYTPRAQSQSLANESISFDGRATHPISALSPYQNKWVIKARVTAKSPIRTWSNAKGEGKLFSMDLMDESGQIRVTGFRDSVDKFYEMIEVNMEFSAFTSNKVHFCLFCHLIFLKFFTILVISTFDFQSIAQIDKIYFFSKAQMKPANKQFSNLPNEYELTLTNDSMIQECTEQSDIPQVTYDFVPISQLSEKENNAVVGKSNELNKSFEHN